MNIAIPFTQYIMSGYEMKDTRHTRMITQFEEKEQASDMAGMQKFKTRTDMVRVPMGEADSI